MDNSKLDGAEFSADTTDYTKGLPPQGTEDNRSNEAQKAAALEGTYHGMILPNEEDVTVGAPSCQRCEVLPQPLRGPGTVHLRLSHTHSLGKVLSYLVKSSWEHKDRNGTVSVHVPEGSLAPLLAPLLKILTSTEQRDTRVMFQPDGHLPRISDYFEVESFPDFTARERSAWLLDIMREQRLFHVFQPIVRRDGDTHQVFAYECLMRARVDGHDVLPGSMIELAKAADLIFQLDLYARRSAITSAARHSIQEKIFVNFTPNAIYEPRSCLYSTVKIIDEVGLRREQVVFEIVESERLPDLSLLKKIVNYYRDQGFGVALDDLGSGYSSLNVLLALQPDYVKLDMELMRGVHEDAAKALVARKLLEIAQDLNVKTVAEGIESQGEYEWVREHGADFMQGYYFARPSTPPPPLLNASAP